MFGMSGQLYGYLMNQMMTGINRLETRNVSEWGEYKSIVWVLRAN